MITDWVTSLGPWSWLVFGAILLGLEILVPGVFLIWIGFAALIVGLLSIALWETTWWVWEIQLLLFAILAGASVLFGRRYFLSSGKDSDQPHLNERGAGLVGRTATLREPITDGSGRVHIDDTVWIVEGPDADVGTKVRIMSSNGRILKVEKA